MSPFLDKIKPGMNIWMKRTNKETAGEIKFCGKVIRRSWRSCFQFELLWSCNITLHRGQCSWTHITLIQTNFKTFLNLTFFNFCINLNGFTTTVQVVLKLFKEIVRPKWKLCLHLLQLNLFQPVCLSFLCRNTKDDNLSVFWTPFTFIVQTISVFCRRMKGILNDMRVSKQSQFLVSGKLSLYTWNKQLTFIDACNTEMYSRDFLGAQRSSKT